MRFFDAHVHADVRSFEDFHTLALLGAKAILICAHNRADFSNQGSLTDHFDDLLNRQCQRVIKNGITPFVALGIHPRGIPKKELAESLAVLPDYLNNQKVVAIGEIGLDLGGELEEKVLYEQLLIAKIKGLPSILHLPPNSKEEMLKRIIQLVDKAELDHGLVLIDHLNRDVFPTAKEEGFYLGLSAHPAKLNPVEIAEIIGEAGPERIVVSSDMGNSAADVGSLPKVIAECKLRHLPNGLIEKVVYSNACDFLKVTLDT